MNRVSNRLASDVCGHAVKPHIALKVLSLKMLSTFGRLIND